jgi:small basic protein
MSFVFGLVIGLVVGAVFHAAISSWIASKAPVVQATIEKEVGKL